VWGRLTLPGGQPTRVAHTCPTGAASTGAGGSSNQAAAKADRYESRVEDNHHHVVCRSCGAVADVDCAVGTAPCLTAADHHGYAIDEAEVSTGACAPDARPDTVPEYTL
jgi:hypothetical protein